MHIGLIGGIGPAATDFYYRGLIDDVIMRLVEIWLAVPFILLQWGFSGADIRDWFQHAFFGFEVGHFKISLARIVIGMLLLRDRKVIVTRRRISLQNATLIFVAINLIVIILFPPFESVFAMTNAAISGFQMMLHQSIRPTPLCNNSPNGMSSTASEAMVVSAAA